MHSFQGNNPYNIGIHFKWTIFFLPKFVYPIMIKNKKNEFFLTMSIIVLNISQKSHSCMHDAMVGFPIDFPSTVQFRFPNSLKSSLCPRVTNRRIWIHFEIKSVFWRPSANTNLNPYLKLHCCMLMYFGKIIFF